MSYSQSGHRSLGQAAAQPDMTFELDASGRAAHEAGYTGPASKTGGGTVPSSAPPSGGSKTGAAQPYAPPVPGSSAYAPVAPSTDYMPWIVGGVATVAGVGLLGWIFSR